MKTLTQQLNTGLAAFAAVLAAVAFASTVRASADPSYTVSAVPVPSGYASSMGLCINDSDNVVGEIYPGSNAGSKAFIDTAGVTKVIEPLAGYKSSTVGGDYALNSHGLVVGYLSKKNGAAAFSDKSNVRTNLTPDTANTTASCVNDNNLIVGDEGKDLFFYQYPGGTTTTVPLPQGSYGSTIYGMNSRGNVVGDALNTVRAKGFLYSNGAVSVLPVPAGIDVVYPTAINLSNLIAGDLYTYSTETSVAATYSNGTWTPITVPSTVSSCYIDSMNNSGVLVGYYTSANFTGAHGFVYTGGVFYDINDLLPGVGYVVYAATSINASGQILAYYYINSGDVVSIILTPDA